MEKDLDRRRLCYQKKVPIKEKMESHEFKFSRDVVQLTNKLKTLRADYRKALEQNNKSGEAPSKFQFFSQMQELLGSRPRNIFPLLCGKESIIINGKLVAHIFKFLLNKLLDFR